MENIKITVGAIVSIIVAFFILSRLDGDSWDAGGFTVFIALGLFFAIAFGIMYGLVYLNDKTEKKINELKKRKTLETQELWKSQPLNEKPNKNTEVIKTDKMTQAIKVGKKKVSLSFWSEVMRRNDIPENFSQIIMLFFLKDNIDFFKYQLNEKANNICYSFGFNEGNNISEVSHRAENEIVNCTPTFRKHFMKSRMDRAMGVPDWFTIAYPDVEHWFRQNMELQGAEIRNNEDLYFTDGMFNNKFYRYIIDTYKNQTKLNLECSVDYDL